MKIEVVNKDCVVMEDYFVETENVSVNGWYGLTYFELCDETNNSTANTMYILNREKFFELKACIDKMAEEINRLENL